MSMYLTILVIFLGTLGVAGYAIFRLSSTPARIVAVILAVATLIGALKPIVATLTDSRVSQVQTVAPNAVSSSAAAPTPPSTSPAQPQGL
ncbi:hypothetical protein [Streptomyces sp. NPDC001621]|uniref:hypothetical protein n=1 Tax=Streptomyces sp. NPDC001621 TaxID=3364594 RepID=UPI00368431AD